MRKKAGEKIGEFMSALYLETKIKELHQKYGASIPSKQFTEEIYKLLTSYKESHEKWLDNDYIWALGNIDRYNQTY